MPFGNSPFAALPAIFAPVCATILAQLVPVLAPLLLVRLLLGKIALEGHPIGGELRLVRFDGRLVVCGAIVGQLLTIVDHLLMRRLDHALVGVHRLDVGFDLRLVGGDLHIRRIVVVGAYAGRREHQASRNPEQHLPHHEIPSTHWAPWPSAGNDPMLARGLSVSVKVANDL